jgi:hypothetical protein
LLCQGGKPIKPKIIKPKRRETKMPHFYKAPDGKVYRLIEANYDMAFRVYRADLKTAVIGDPENCVAAKGICRNHNVLYAWVGSGESAYVIFKGRDGEEDYAVHFILRAKAQRVRDTFDLNKQIKSQVLILGAVAPSKARSARYASMKRRREEIKNGSPVAKREHPGRPRMVRIGVPHRPRAVITKGLVTAI